MEIFDVLELGSVRLANRLAMAPLKTAYNSKDGKITSKTIEFFRRRAQGGVGLIISEPLYVSLEGKEHPKQLGIDEDDKIEGLVDLVDAVHQEGSKIFAHLNHGGRAANPKASGKPAKAPSPVTCQAKEITPEQLSIDEIRYIVNCYANAALRAKRAGFDGIELQCGLGYLVAQFLSPKTNLRTDEYGNGYKFLEEVIDAVKQHVPERYPIIARISMDEKVEGGLKIEDTIRLASFLAGKGLAAIHVVSGNVCDSPPFYFQYMSLPKQFNLKLALILKEKIDLPIIVAGRMGEPDDIRLALSMNIDGVALGRPLISDPDLPIKIMQKREDEILRCGACLQGCLLKVKSGEGIGCSFNPQVGREGEVVGAAEKRKKVVVVGGGPAGMQFALTAKQRGHKVVLFDDNDLGGQMRYCFLAPGKEMMRKPCEFLPRAIKEAGIKLNLGTHADLDSIIQEKPDEVIIATGAKAKSVDIPGLEKQLTGLDVFSGKFEIGHRVLILGGGMVGIEIADLLSQEGHSVTIIEILDCIGKGMVPFALKSTKERFKNKDIKIFTNARLISMDKGKAIIKQDKEQMDLGSYDTVVVTIGTMAQKELIEPIEHLGIPVHVIGDARKPGTIFDAVHQGYQLALKI